MVRAVEQLCLVGVVGATAKLDVLHRGLAADAMRLLMMELEEAAFAATSSALTDERATTAVA